MQVLTPPRSHFGLQDCERDWPLDARMAMFVLEAGGQNPLSPRDRAADRQACRMIATLTAQDQRRSAHAVVYVRDRDAGHVGFICQNTLPVGSAVWLDCESGQGQSLRTPGRVARLRPFMSGWHEGVLHL